MNIKDLIDSRNNLAADLRAMHESAEAEDRSFTPEEREKWDQIEADLSTFETRIKDAERVARFGEDLTVPVVKEVPHAQDQTQRRAIEGNDKAVTYEDAFSNYLRRGISGLSNDERMMMLEKRAQGTAPGSAGGYTVPTDMANRIIEAMKQYGGLVNVANVMTTASGAPIDFPGNDDTGNIGAILAENTQVSEGDTTFTSKTLGAHKYTSNIIRVSLELLQDNEVNLENYLVQMLGKRIGRAESAHFCVGDGSSEPEGITIGATNQTTAAGATAITYADMLDLEHAVDPAYREGGVGTFVFNDGTLKILKGLVDGEGRPLWLPAVAESAPATILGRRYQIDQGMPDIGTGNVSAVFGDMSAYTIRRAMGISLFRLEERYLDYYQYGFVGFSRTDAKLLDVSAVAGLAHP